MIGRVVRTITEVAYESVPRRVRHRIRRLRKPAYVDSLRRTTPLSDQWGYDRGNPVDRYYIESFLEEHRADIKGRSLEVMDLRYVDRFGSGVTRRDVLDVDASNRRATIVADLADATTIPDDSFDCIVLTQVLQLVFDVRAAIAHLERILKPGGVLLATVPGISRIGKREQATDLWRFTPVACRRLLGANFDPEEVEVRSYGNVLSANAFLTGIAAEELSRQELDTSDPSYPVIVAVRARKRDTPVPGSRHE
jgi:SAM-dependent methyltransferase